ncbi:hypothetical protein PR048_014725 [Dryococelus australis]|uniref:Uncharacterized protein n=1 Tax=Dryococelus australis TaxID=614101 RepID=A0ABQ9HEZ8_9NEOP|nr:hypothetical protein PR048_014725 [Dryococelus australis]
MSVVIPPRYLRACRHSMELYSPLVLLIPSHHYSYSSSVFNLSSLLVDWLSALHNVPSGKNVNTLIRWQGISARHSLLSSLATQGGIGDIPDLLHKVPGMGSLLQQTGPAQFPSSMVGQLLGDYLPTQGLGQLLQGLGQYPQQYPQQYPLQQGGASLVGALTAIAAYDDLQCVPRLLCEVAAGGRPGQSGKKDSLIPFLNKDMLITLLTIFNLGGTSPLLVFGRAVLLGVTAQGRPSACLSAYPTCPRDAEQLVYYLNNHRGGFFQFFNNYNRPPVLRPYQGRIQNYQQVIREAPTTPSPPTITAPPPPPPVYQVFQREEPQHAGEDFQFPLRNENPAINGGFRKGKLLKFPFAKEEEGVYSMPGHRPATSSNVHFAFPENEVYGSNDVAGDAGHYGHYQHLWEGDDGKAVVFPVFSGGVPLRSPHKLEVPSGGHVVFPAEDDAVRSPLAMVFPERMRAGDLRLHVEDDGNPAAHSALGSGVRVFRTAEDNRVLRFPSSEEEAVASNRQAKEIPETSS